MIRLARLVSFAAVSGGLAGVASYAFLKALTWATTSRVEHGWLLWLLPLAGLVIGTIYHYLAGHAAKGTRHAVREARSLSFGAPARMAPLVFGCAVLGHLCGASVGREGAAVQMSASITDTGARLLKLRSDDRQILLVASLAGGFSSIIGTPFAAVAFALLLTKRRSPLNIITCAVSAVAGYFVVRWLDGVHRLYPAMPHIDWTLALPFKLIVAGALVGVVGRLYMWVGDSVTRFMSGRVAWPPVRPVVGGFATIGLAALFGRDYLGLSLPLLGQAIAGQHIDWWVPVLKLVFTVVALGTGFVGGEVIPLFVIGATLGATLAPSLHVSPALFAACGLATLFTTAAQVPLVGVIMATELFGWNTTVPVVVVAAAAWVALGREGLYINRGESEGLPADAPLTSHEQ
ncbi:MAG TPA: chloride channel protein [Ilumatobacteraceae bacterium]|nr:chloride channel protein [Ilumatobacteraceae bacterium]